MLGKRQKRKEENYYTLDSLETVPLDAALEQRLWEGLERAMGRERYRTRVMVWTKVAAVFFLLLGGITWYVQYNRDRLDIVAFMDRQEEQRALNDGQGQLVVGTEKKQYIQDGKEDFRLAMGNQVTMVKSHDTVRIEGGEARDMLLYVKVPSQEILHLIMNDGTSCLLSANTLLAFNSNYRGKRRLMSMTGTGRFDVVHDSKRPMSLLVDQDSIRDLGTVFFASYRKASREAIVAVAKGKVSVDREELVPGEQLRFGKGHPVVRENCGIDRMEEQYISTSCFHFYGERMDAVLEEISKWYGLKLKVQPGLDYKTFTGQLPKNMSVDSIADMLTDLSGYAVRVQKEPQGTSFITVYKK